MQDNSSSRNILSQELFVFECPEKHFSVLSDYAKNIEWESLKSRVSSYKNIKGGRSFTGKLLTLSKNIELIDLHQWIEECLNLCFKEIGWDSNYFEGLSITQSWLNFSATGEGHHPHYHSLSILSGILYLTSDCSTQFFSPSIYRLPDLIAPRKDSNKMIKEHVQMKKGTLIIFPSSLLHMVGPNMKKEVRITMSINSWFTGQIGNPRLLSVIPPNL